MIPHVLILDNTTVIYRLTYFIGQVRAPQAKPSEYLAEIPKNFKNDGYYVSSVPKWLQKNPSVW